MLDSGLSENEDLKDPETRSFSKAFRRLAGRRRGRHRAGRPGACRALRRPWRSRCDLWRDGCRGFRGAASRPHRGGRIHRSPRNSAQLLPDAGFIFQTKRRARLRGHAQRLLSSADEEPRRAPCILGNCCCRSDGSCGGDYNRLRAPCFQHAKKRLRQFGAVHRARSIRGAGRRRIDRERPGRSGNVHGAAADDPAVRVRHAGAGRARCAEKLIEAAKSGDIEQPPRADEGAAAAALGRLWRSRRSDRLPEGARRRRGGARDPGDPA